MTSSSWFALNKIRFIQRLDTSHPGYALATILTLILLRIIIETALYHQGQIDGLSVLYQFVWFCTAFLYSILILVYLGNWTLAHAMHLAALCSPLLLVTPAVDFILGVHRTTFPTFLAIPEGDWQRLVVYFLLIESNLTPGMLIEIALLMALVLIFTILFSGWIRAILVTFLIYSGLWLLGAYPILLTYLMHCPAQAHAHFPLLGSLFILFAITLLTTHYRWLTTVLTDPPSLLRFIFYFGLLIAAAWGSALAYQPATPLQPQFTFRLLFAGFTLYSWLVAARLANDLFDIDADRINEPHRPLAANLTTPREVWHVLALITALATLCTLFFLTDIPTALNGLLLAAPFLLYWLYSVPPFRLKRVLFLGKFLIGSIALMHLLTGWVLTSGSLNGFPPELIGFALIGIGFSAHVIDLKDERGDRIAGIPTLATVLPPRSARLLISVFVLIAYGLAFWTAYRLHWYLPIMYGVLLLAGIEVILILVPRWYTDTRLFFLHALGSLGFAFAAFYAWFQIYG